MIKIRKYYGDDKKNTSSNFSSKNNEKEKDIEKSRNNNDKYQRGEWECEKCRSVNFSQRSECYKCHYPKREDNCQEKNERPSYKSSNYEKRGLKI